MYRNTYSVYIGFGTVCGFRHQVGTSWNISSVDKGGNTEYSYSGILVSHKKACSTDICYSMHNSPKHYAKYKKPDTRLHIL